MVKCRVVYKPDGTVAVIHYAPKSKHSYTIAMWRAMKASGFMSPDGVEPQRIYEFEDINVLELPRARKYRSAWRKQKGKAFILDTAIKFEIDSRRSQIEEDKISVEIQRQARDGAIAELKSKGEIT